MTYVKVENNPYLVRDSRSKAILNTNTDGLIGYKKDRETRIRMSKLIDETDDLIKKVDDMSITLKLILSKLEKE